MFKPLLGKTGSQQKLVTYFSTTSRINQHYVTNKPQLPKFVPKPNQAKGLQKNHRFEPWTYDEVMKSTEDHAMYTWGATDPMRKSAIAFQRGEGIYLIDYQGKKYIDMSSQAINNNLGYSIPDNVLNAITRQLKTLHQVYGGLTISEPRAKLAQIMSDISPPGITGFLFPNSGSDANEVAMRAARRFTNRHKIITRYKSFHGGGTGPLTATGDFRRQFAETGVSGFVKILDL